jgi:hypothetical protein
MGLATGKRLLPFAEYTHAAGLWILLAMNRKRGIRCRRTPAASNTYRNAIGARSRRAPILLHRSWRDLYGGTSTATPITNPSYAPRHRGWM